MRRATARILLVLAAPLVLTGLGLAVLGTDWAARRTQEELVPR